MQSRGSRRLPRQIDSRRKLIRGDVRYSGKWNDKQQARYAQFLYAHLPRLVRYLKYQPEVSRKMWSERIFQELAEYIVTRSPQQCYTHNETIMGNYTVLEDAVRECVKRVWEKEHQEWIQNGVIQNCQPNKHTQNRANSSQLTPNSPIETGQYTVGTQNNINTQNTNNTNNIGSSHRISINLRSHKQFKTDSLGSKNSYNQQSGGKQQQVHSYIKQQQISQQVNNNNNDNNQSNIDLQHAIYSSKQESRHQSINPTFKTQQCLPVNNSYSSQESLSQQSIQQESDRQEDESQQQQQLKQQQLQQQQHKPKLEIIHNQDKQIPKLQSKKQAKKQKRIRKNDVLQLFRMQKMGNKLFSMECCHKQGERLMGGQKKQANMKDKQKQGQFKKQGNHQLLLVSNNKNNSNINNNHSNVRINKTIKNKNTFKEDFSQSSYRMEDNSDSWGHSEKKNSKKNGRQKKIVSKIINSKNRQQMQQHSSQELEPIIMNDNNINNNHQNTNDNNTINNNNNPTTTPTNNPTNNNAPQTNTTVISHLKGKYLQQYSGESSKRYNDILNNHPLKYLLDLYPSFHRSLQKRLPQLLLIQRKYDIKRNQCPEPHLSIRNQQLRNPSRQPAINQPLRYSLEDILTIAYRRVIGITGRRQDLPFKMRQAIQKWENGRQSVMPGMEFGGVKTFSQENQ